MANCVRCGRNLPAFSFGRKICSWCVQHEAAQRGLEPEDAVQRIEAPPWLRRQGTSGIVTKAIFGINVAVFLGMLFAGVFNLENPGPAFVHWGANYGPATLNGEWWRLLTYMFEHGSVIHIALNMWCLWNLGTMAESLYGPWTYAVTYLLCGVTGGLGSIIWHPNVPSVGASGAIFGIAGALIASFYLGEFLLPRAAISGTLRSVVVFVGYNLVFGAAISGVDNAAHIGGLIGGLVLGALIAKAAPDQSDSGRRVVVLVVMVALIGGGAAWWLHSRDYLRHMQRGNGFLAEAKTDQAIAEFQAVLRQRPHYAQARYRLAQAYIRKNDYAKAEAELEIVVAMAPEDTRSPYLLGFLYLQEGKPPQARSTFQKMLAKDPKDAEAHYGLGSTATAEGNFPEAIAEYKLAAQLDPEMERVYYDLGRVQAKLNLYDDAIASFKKELEKVGDDPDVEDALASAYDAKGMKKEAAEARQKAAALTGQK